MRYLTSSQCNCCYVGVICDCRSRLSIKPRSHRTRRYDARRRALTIQKNKQIWFRRDMTLRHATCLVWVLTISNISFIWSRWRALEHVEARVEELNRAAAFCTRCRGARVDVGRLASTKLWQSRREMTSLKIVHQLWHVSYLSFVMHCKLDLCSPNFWTSCYLDAVHTCIHTTQHYSELL